ELYGDFRNYGVAGAPLTQRRDSLNDFLQHELALASAAPDTAGAARSFLQSAYSPLANAAWSYTSAFGWTAVPFDQMQDYVSAQTYALRHASAQAPLDRGGFAWAPKNVGLSTSDFTSQTGVVMDRLAAAIRDSGQTVDPNDPGVGACGPAGQNLWCTAGIGGAWFNDSWKLLASWRPSLLAFTTPAQTLTAGVTSAPVSVQLQTSMGAPLTATSPLQVTVATSSLRAQLAPTPTGPWTPTL